MTGARKRCGGFSFIELIMVIVVLAIVGVVGADMVIQGALSHFEARDYRDAVQELRYAIERMSREIREDIDTPSADITTMTATNLTYKDTGGTSIAFALNGTDLERDSVDLAKNISALTFTYLKADGTTAAAAANVWKIQIAMTATVEGQAVSIRTVIFPRNVYNDTTQFKEWQES